MKQLFRSLALGLTALTCMAAFAQPVPPYTVTVSGMVVGCVPPGVVNILSVQGTVPGVDIDVPLDANCGFSLDLLMDSYTGWFVVSTPCGGAIQSATVTYTVGVLGTAAVAVTLDCGSSNVDCLGIIGGTAWPGTPCDDNDPNTFNDVWDASCECAGGAPVPCEACITVGPAFASPNGGGAIPWAVQATNCSDGVQPISYVIEWGDGVTGGANPHVYSQAGQYYVCILINDASGCTSTACDSVVVDENGNVNPFIVDPVGCEAAFWVFQAYEVDPNNPNGGGTPIPNVLWIWNLSSGGTGNYQYQWNFGDGTSSTDAYPTHFYANGGPYQLCLTMYDGSCQDTYCDDVSVDDDGIYSGMILQEEYARSGFTINVLEDLSSGVGDGTIGHTALWPNPVADQLNLSFNTTTRGNLPVTIMDMDGRVLRTSNERISSGTNRFSMAVSDLVSGIYVVRFGSGSDAVNLRFVKR